MLINLREIFFRHKQLIFTIFIIFLLFLIISLGVKCYFLQQEGAVLDKQLEIRNGDKKIVNFLNFFIEKVLQSEEDISFEDRLKLENAVRDLNDDEILSLWESFTEATTADDVQTYCKNLLELLAKKLL